MNKWLSITFVAIVYSCATVNSQSLYTQVNYFLKFLRWGRVKEAAQFVIPEQRKNFLLYYQRMEVNFTDIQVLNLNVDDRKKEGDVQIEVSYYRTPQMVMKKKTLKLLWKVKGDNWFLYQGWELK